MGRHGSRPTDEGHLLTMDWLILKSEVSRGIDKETVMLVLLDVGSEFLTVFPSAKRDAAAVYNGILKAYGTRCQVLYCRMDDAEELKRGCEKHGIPYMTSAPYIHQTNCLIESHNCIELFGGRVSLEQ